jgi:hypothetical protein
MRLGERLNYVWQGPPRPYHPPYSLCLRRLEQWESTTVRATGDTKESATGDSTCSFSPNPNPKEVPAQNRIAIYS